MSIYSILSNRIVGWKPPVWLTTILSAMSRANSIDAADIFSSENVTIIAKNIRQWKIRSRFLQFKTR